MQIYRIQPALQVRLCEMASQPTEPVFGERYIDTRDCENVRLVAQSDLNTLIVRSFLDNRMYPVSQADFRNWYRPL